jgi:rod shape-determining protein MreC
MLKYLKEYRFYISLGLFVLIPTLYLDTASRSPRDYHFYDRVLNTLLTPVQLTVHYLMDKTVDFTQSYLYLIHTKKINEDLLVENQKLFGELSSLKEASLENDRLKGLLDFRETHHLKTVTARMIARDVSVEYRSIRINRGENAGITKGMAVVTPAGIVGRVFRVTATTADVMTVVDLLSSIDSVIERSRVRGVVEGLTDETCSMRFTQRNDDIQVGDTLVSTGLGGIFPRGISVGTVIQVRKKTYGITQEVEVKPAVDFNKLEEVLVVTESQTTPLKTQKP